MAIKSKIKSLIQYCIDQDYRDYRRIRSLHVFDPGYFFKVLERGGLSVSERSADPLLLFFQWSRKQLNRPEALNMSRAQFIAPHPLFDTYYYLARYGSPNLRRNPFAHYLMVGWKRGWQPSPYFDPELYRQRSGWTETEGDPLTHYTRYGAAAGISPGHLFDIDWYLDKTPVLISEKNNIIRHYKLYGSSAGKSPVPVFEPRLYLAQLEPNDEAPLDPMAHYAGSQEPDKIRPASYFDPAYYRHRYMTGIIDELALTHYLRAGVYQQTAPDQRIADLEQKPVISLIVPVYDPEPCFLNNCIRSVLYQAYPHWELLLIDDCSANDQVRSLIRTWSTRDSRIRCDFNQENLGIAATSQKGAEQAAGTYLGFLDHDDELSTDCLFEVAEAINRTGAEVIYSDESLIGDDGALHDYFHKPDFNLELLYSHNYITHFVAVSADLFNRVGGLSSRFDGAQDYDLMLRLAENVDYFHHIPRVLYHWRAIDTSTSIAHDQKPYAHEAGKKALLESLERSGFEALVEDGPINFHYRIRWPRASQASVTAIFFANGPEHSATEWAHWLRQRTSYERCSFDIRFDKKPTIKQELDDSTTRKADLQESFRYIAKTKQIQEAVSGSDSDYIAILGHGADDLAKDWLDELVACLEHYADVDIVCGRAFYDGGDGPSYLVPDLVNHSVEYFASFLSSASRHEHGMHNLQLVPCCDWQITLLRRSQLEAAGGFDSENFPDRLAMLDLCLRVRAQGGKILYNPYAVVRYNRTSAETHKSLADASGEKRLFQSIHREVLQRFDPYYNIGPLLEQGISLERFYGWLAGHQNPK